MQLTGNQESNFPNPNLPYGRGNSKKLALGCAPALKPAAPPSAGCNPSI